MEGINKKIMWQNNGLLLTAEEKYGYQEDMEKRQITDYSNITGVLC